MKGNKEKLCYEINKKFVVIQTSNFANFINFNISNIFQF